MVYPVYNLVFKLNTANAGETKVMSTVAEMETFEPSIDGNVEEWTPMTTQGWANALMTGKKFTISLSGKRAVGDPGNDYVAAAAWKDGLDCNTDAEIEFPDGSTLSFPCVLDVKSPFGGDSTNVSKLEFDMISRGKPTYTAA